MVKYYPPDGRAQPDYEDLVRIVELINLSAPMARLAR
jgi:hypothetical protein